MGNGIKNPNWLSLIISYTDDLPVEMLPHRRETETAFTAYRVSGLNPTRQGRESLTDSGLMGKTKEVVVRQRQRVDTTGLSRVTVTGL